MGNERHHQPKQGKEEEKRRDKGAAPWRSLAAGLHETAAGMVARDDEDEAGGCGPSPMHGSRIASMAADK